MALEMNHQHYFPEVKENGPEPQKLRHEVSSVAAPPFFRVKKLSGKAILPSRGSPHSAGYDLSSAVDTKVPARGNALVPTDLAIAVPVGTYARVAPRSGLAWKNSIDVGAGVIDADYRGPVGVILFNHSDIDFEIKAGDRIAQLIVQEILTPEVEVVDDLDATVRGSGGFGSTGVSVKDFEKFKDEITPSTKASQLQYLNDILSESENPATESLIPTSPKLSFSINQDGVSGGSSSRGTTGAKNARMKRKNAELSALIEAVNKGNDQIVKILREINLQRQDFDIRQLDIKRRRLALSEMIQEDKMLLRNLSTITDPRVYAYAEAEKRRIIAKRSQQDK